MTNAQLREHVEVAHGFDTVAHDDYAVERLHHNDHTMHHPGHPFVPHEHGEDE